MKKLLRAWLHALKMVGLIVGVLVVSAVFTNRETPFMDKLLGLSGFALMALALSMPLGLLLWLGDRYYKPWRVRKLQKRIIALYGGEAVTAEITKIKHGQFEVVVRVEVSMGISKGRKGETVTFFVPAAQLSHLTLRPSFTERQEQVHGAAMHCVCITHGAGLKSARRTLEQELGPL